MLVAELLVILLPTLLELLLCVMQPTQLFVPLGFQDIHHEAVAWIDLHEATPGQVSLLSSSLHALVP